MIRQASVSCRAPLQDHGIGPGRRTVVFCFLFHQHRVAWRAHDGRHCTGRLDHSSGRTVGHSPLYHTPVQVVGLYWSFVDIVWLTLYPLIYLIGRR